MPDLVPARMLNELVYCPRLFYLEWVQGEFAHNADVVQGLMVHKRVDQEKGAMPSPGDVAASGSDAGFTAKSVTVSGDVCGIIAKVDIVEGDGGYVSPVDYKKGSPPDSPGMVWEPDRVQAIAQVAVLREAGYVCKSAILYYAETKQRIEVPVSDEDLKMLKTLVESARSHAALAIPPPPLVDSPKCPRCSLVGICLPDETRFLELAGDATDSPAEAPDVRRLYPARDDALPVYVQEQGAVLRKNGEVIEITKGGQLIDKARLFETSQVSLFGSVQMTPSVVHTLCERQIPICHFSYGGWFYGMTRGMPHKNIQLRIAQFRIASEQTESMHIARKFIEGKLRNCRTVLRRNHKGDCGAALAELDRLSGLVERTRDIDELMGIEGAGARVYFSTFSGLLKDAGQGEFSFDFQTRNRRPPTDPVNSLLSFMYAILSKDMAITVMSVGFDPLLGFLHRPRYGRPALALDLMEEFRPIIADSTVITLINNNMVGSSHFVKRGNSWALTAMGRRTVLDAYERRMDTLVTHPMFGYSVSYRRILEVQSRLLSRHVLGELPEYTPFCTR